MKFRFRREWVPILLAAIAFGIGSLGSPYFLDARYLLDASSLYIEIGLLALGMTFVIVGGHIDLSVASTLALVACTTAKMLASGVPVPVALLGGLAFGAALGNLNGQLITRLGLPSFMVSLATMAAYRGIAQVMAGAESIRMPAALTGIDFLQIPGTPIPTPLAILLGFGAVCAVLLHRTVWGRWLFSLGTNERASFYSGVPTDRVVRQIFTLSGFLAGVAGLIIASRLGVARFDHGRGMEVDAITAVVVGGASIYGGIGTISGTLWALLLIALIRTGMGVANVTAEYQLAAIGTLLVLSVIVSNAVERFGARRAASPTAGKTS